MDLAAKGHIANVQVRVPYFPLSCHGLSLIYANSAPTSVQKFGAP